MYVLILSAVIYICRDLFTSFELISLNIKFIPAILLVAGHTLISFKESRYQLATTSLFAVPLFLTAQTLLPDSTQKIPLKILIRRRSNRIKGLMQGPLLANIMALCATILVKRDAELSIQPRIINMFTELPVQVIPRLK